MSVDLLPFLRFLHKRLAQVKGEGFPVPIDGIDRHTMTREAVQSGRRIVASGQADILEEIIRYLHKEFDLDAKHAPYVLQAWSEGTYFYYVGTEWQPSLAGARTFPTLLAATGFIAQKLTPGPARDGVLVVSLREAQKQA